MQISFKQEDVERAIALYLQSMGITAKVAKVSFVAGRKDSGLRTTIDLEHVEHAPIPKQPLKQRVLGSVIDDVRTDDMDGFATADDGELEQASDNFGEDESPLPDQDVKEDEDSTDDSEANSQASKSLFD